MKPWREIAIPHADVLKGTFLQSEFAADITAVHTGKAPCEYQDAAAFFELIGSIADEARVLEYAAARGYPVPRVEEVRAEGTEIVMERIDGPMMMDVMTKDPRQLLRQTRVLADLLCRRKPVGALASILAVYFLVDLEFVTGLPVLFATANLAVTGSRRTVGPREVGRSVPDRQVTRC